MVKSNEFYGATLFEAARKATAAYRHEPIIESKDQRRCNDLVLEISSLKRTIGRAADDAERAARQADRLRNSARRELLLSALAALGTIARALRGFALAWRRLKNRDISRLTEREIVDLLSTLGPIGASLAALYAIENLREASRLARRAEEIEENAEKHGEQLLASVREYSRLGCGRPRRLTS